MRSCRFWDRWPPKCFDRRVASPSPSRADRKAFTSSPTEEDQHLLNQLTGRALSVQALPTAHLRALPAERVQPYILIHGRPCPACPSYDWNYVTSSPTVVTAASHWTSSPALLDRTEQESLIAWTRSRSVSVSSRPSFDLRSSVIWCTEVEEQS